MTLLAGCVIACNSRRSSTGGNLDASAATNMETTSEVVDPTDVGDPMRCYHHSTASPGSSPRVVADTGTGNGSSSSPLDELDSGHPERSSPSVARDAKAPILSFSVAAIMARSSSPPPSSRTRPPSAVEVNHHNHHPARRHQRHRRNSGPVSPVSPPSTSPRRSSAAFTVDGILNGVGRTSSRSDDGEDSSCSAADDSASNRSSPFVPPPSSVGGATVTARQNLPFLHPAASVLDVACKWPPTGCPYPWQYAHPPSE